MNILLLLQVSIGNGVSDKGHVLDSLESYDSYLSPEVIYQMSLWRGERTVLWELSDAFEVSVRSRKVFRRCTQELSLGNL